MFSLIKKMRSISFSKRCILCQCKYQAKFAVCPTCQHHLPRLSNPCLSCAQPLPSLNPPYCNDCLKNPPIIDQININYPFIDPLRTLIHTFKFTQGLYLTSFLAELMLNRTHTIDLPELLVPVPLHPLRLRQRGFNQALLLARYLSRQLQVPYQAALCHKIKNTPAQTTLSAESRQHHLLDTFTVLPMDYQHIALIDDVYTTGATVHALARAFKEQGVGRVDVWCVAKTLKVNDSNPKDLCVL
jgi:ComF family protein